MKAKCMDCEKEFEISNMIPIPFTLEGALDMMQNLQGTEYDESIMDWLEDVGTIEYQCKECNKKLRDIIDEILDTALN